MDVRCRQSDLQSQDAPIARGLRSFFSAMGEQDGSDYTAPQSVSDLLVLQKDYGIRFPGSIMTSFIGGCDGPADTPDPIPNSEVKRPGGENTLTGKIAAAAFYVINLRPFVGTFLFLYLLNRKKKFMDFSSVSLGMVKYGSCHFERDR